MNDQPEQTSLDTADNTTVNNVDNFTYAASPTITSTDTSASSMNDFPQEDVIDLLNNNNSTKDTAQSEKALSSQDVEDAIKTLQTQGYLKIHYTTLLKAHNQHLKDKFDPPLSTSTIQKMQRLLTTYVPSYYDPFEADVAALEKRRKTLEEEGLQLQNQAELIEKEVLATSDEKKKKEAAELQKSASAKLHEAEVCTREILNKSLEIDKYEFTSKKPKYHGDIKYNIAFCHSLLGNYDVAYSYLEQATALYVAKKDHKTVKKLWDRMNNIRIEYLELPPKPYPERNPSSKTGRPPAHTAARKSNTNKDNTSKKGNRKRRRDEKEETDETYVPTKTEQSLSDVSDDESIPTKKMKKDSNINNNSNDSELFDEKDTNPASSSSSAKSLTSNVSDSEANQQLSTGKSKRYDFFGGKHKNSNSNNNNIHTSSVQAKAPEILVDKEVKSVQDEIKEVSGKIIVLSNKSQSNSFTPEDRYQLSVCYSRISFLYARADKKTLSKDYAERANNELEQARCDVLKNNSNSNSNYRYGLRQKY